MIIFLSDRHKGEANLRIGKLDKVSNLIDIIILKKQLT